MVRACNVANAAAGKVAKFLALYEGPYNMKKRIARNIYILSDVNTEQERGQFHSMSLKPYHTNNDGAGVGVTKGRRERMNNQGKRQEKSDSVEGRLVCAVV